MNLKEIVYERLDIEVVKENMRSLTEELSKAKNKEACFSVIANIGDIFAKALDKRCLANTRYDLNIHDSFYKEESKYYGTELPHLQNLMAEFYAQLLKSPFKEVIEEKYGSVFLQMAETESLEIDSVFVENNQKMNQLSRSYFRLRSAAKIEVGGNTYSVQGINRFRGSADRAIRKKALSGFWDFMDENSGEIDTLFLNMRSIRQETAEQLGYKNYVALGYQYIRKYDYTPADMEIFRTQVRESVIPLYSKIQEEQKKKLGYEKLYYYDSVFFKTGNAQLKGGLSMTLDNFKKTFEEMSPQTAKLWDYMMENNWFDFSDNKNKKQGANYCRTFPYLGKPFISIFFMGTTGNVKIIFHEFGHAFQKQQSREVGQKWFGYFQAAPDIGEIHSTAMEYFAWNWYPLFFGEDAQKFRYQKLRGVLALLLGASIVDDFQHFIYESPQATIDELEHKYAEIERHYKPYINYDGNTFLEKGGHWRSMSNIVSPPFHFISYALSTVCALQFWKKSQEDFEGAWQDYLRLCKVGGSVGFKEALEIANLKSPFEAGTLQEVIGFVEEWLDSVDTTGW